jgi:hypothetical protein
MGGKLTGTSGTPPLFAQYDVKTDRDSGQADIFESLRAAL